MRELSDFRTPISADFIVGYWFQPNVVGHRCYPAPKLVYGNSRFPKTNSVVQYDAKTNTNQKKHSHTIFLLKVELQPETVCSKHFRHLGSIHYDESELSLFRAR